jgi:hypothetical protein
MAVQQLYPGSSIEVIEHERTFHRFVLGLKWIVLLHLAGLSFLVLLFCTPAGFVGSALTGVIIFAIGAPFLLREPG